MRPIRPAALVLAALLASGCGEIFGELDHANDLASKPSGNRPPAAAPGGALAAKSPPSAAGPAATGAEQEAAPTVLARVQGWLGLEGARQDGRRPPDPNDPMVLCRIGGSSSFMLKSGCLNRRGTVVAGKGVPH